MALLTDGLLMAASLFAGGYCWVLARRVNALKDLDKGLGGSIVSLTRQIELARSTLEEARTAARETRHDLGQLSARAEAAAGQLRLLLATVQEAPTAQTAIPAFVPEPLAPRSEPVRAPKAAAPRAKAEPAPVAQPALAQAPVPAPAAQAPAVPEIPKPRALPPRDGPLLRRGRPEPAARSEDEIIDALRALAGGRA
ncbi:MAG: hypothetical protein U1E34_02475 [Amaricoccus sp.]